MGRALSWLVIETNDADAVAAALGAKRTGITSTPARRTLTARPLPSGGYLLVVAAVDHPAFGPPQRAALSRLAPLTFCEFEEHVMWSAAERWERGARTWSVAHQGEDSVLSIAVDGNVPGDFAAMKDAAFAQQIAEGGEHAGVDLVFDLPIDFARAHGGVHPEDALFNEAVFEVLDPELPRRLPFGVRLLGYVAAFLFLVWLAGWLFRWTKAQFSG